MTELIAVAYTEFGPSYGGAWIDHETGGVLRVAVTEDVPVERAREALARSRLVAPEYVEVETVGHSYAELLATYEALNAQRMSSSLLFGVMLDEPRNRVVVDFKEMPSAEQERVLAVAPSDAVVEGFLPPAPGEDACTEDACDPPLRGGILADGPLFECTYGFAAHARTSSNLYIITAGHCASAVGQPFSHDGHTVGSVNGLLDSGDIDMARIGPLSSSYWNPTISDNGVYRNSSSPNFPIYRFSESFQNTTGIMVCRNGISSPYDCGQITASRISPPESNNTNMFEYDMCGIVGDSGAGVYSTSDNRARGLHIASTNTQTSCPAMDLSYAVHIDDQQDRFNIEVNVV